MLRIAQDDPGAATVALAPVISGSAPLVNAHLWDVQAFLPEAIARDALGDVGAARHALERALHLAKPESLLFSFLLDPAPEPLSQSESRVLRYLPTKLSTPEIADQLYLSVNTVKTHMRHLYDKLGAHRPPRGRGAGPRPWLAGSFTAKALITASLPRRSPGPRPVGTDRTRAGGDQTAHSVALIGPVVPRAG